MLVIGNKKYRNLQEQVGWNTEQIEKIFEFLDGINVSDNVVVVTDISTPLTTEELEIVNREVAFIVYNGELYFKKNQDSSNIYFDIVFEVSGTTVITLASSEITVTKSNGALGITNSSVNVYSKNQVDTLLSSKADTSYVSAQLALKANLTGAAFTGAISAPSIIENMTGYTYQKDITIAWNDVYVGCVKNGNKVTFVVFGSYTKQAGDSDTRILAFNIPAPVGAKLYPYTIGTSTTNLDNRIVPLFSDRTTFINCVFETQKQADTRINVYIRNLSSLTNGTEYLFRYEVTFLLSDNLES